MAQAGADAVDFIGRYRCTHAATANHHASPGFLAENRFADGLGEIRIISGGCCACPGRLPRGLIQAAGREHTALIQIPHGLSR